MSSRNADPDSPLAIAHRAEAVRSFLDRHGFSDVDSPRELDESHRIQMKPVYPIEVASDLGKVAMVNMLLDAGAVPNPVRKSNSAPSSPTSQISKGSLFSFASFCGSRGQRDEAAAASQSLEPQPASQPLRSCLADGSSRSRLESSSFHGKDPKSSRWV